MIWHSHDLLTHILLIKLILLKRWCSEVKFAYWFRHRSCRHRVSRFYTKVFRLIYLIWRWDIIALISVMVFNIRKTLIAISAIKDGWQMIRAVVFMPIIILNIFRFGNHLLKMTALFNLEWICIILLLFNWFRWDSLSILTQILFFVLDYWW